ncbi:uncharacterized protein [Palaemon carinicauda]|uniref:uncharacterized protein n=1 Tax=Palaemon carinicauda TaxID=392227 RepID=UPI0035B65D9C
MHQTAVSSAVWQRRTNKIIAVGITIIGLTMMLSLIPQCIFIGVVFVSCSLIWLGWMTVKEKKVEPPRPEEHPASPVLFLVASHHLRQTSRGPTLPDPEDKPPSYDQILKLDGLPPDYYSILAEKPPRYEDLSPTLGWGACALPVELYTTELPCVHSTQSTPVGSPPPVDVALRPAESSTSSAFMNELPTSWSAQSLLPPTYTASGFARENPSFEPFARENPSFEPVVVGRDDSSEKDELNPTDEPPSFIVATAMSRSSSSSSSFEDARQEISKVTEDVSHV